MSELMSERVQVFIQNRRLFLGKPLLDNLRAWFSSSLCFSSTAPKQAAKSQPNQTKIWSPPGITWCESALILSCFGFFWVRYYKVLPLYVVEQ